MDLTTFMQVYNYGYQCPNTYYFIVCLSLQALEEVNGREWMTKIDRETQGATD